MWIAGAGMALGSRLIAKWTVYPVRGLGPLRNEKPRMGVRGWIGRGLIGLLGNLAVVLDGIHPSTAGHHPELLALHHPYLGGSRQDDPSRIVGDAPLISPLS